MSFLSNVKHAVNKGTHVVEDVVHKGTHVAEDVVDAGTQIGSHLSKEVISQIKNKKNELEGIFSAIANDGLSVPPAAFNAIKENANLFKAYAQKLANCPKKELEALKRISPEEMKKIVEVLVHKGAVKAHPSKDKSITQVVLSTAPMNVQADNNSGENPTPEDKPTEVIIKNTSDLTPEEHTSTLDAVSKWVEGASIGIEGLLVANGVAITSASALLEGSAGVSLTIGLAIIGGGAALTPATLGLSDLIGFTAGSEFVQLAAILGTIGGVCLIIDGINGGLIAVDGGLIGICQLIRS